MSYDFTIIHEQVESSPVAVPQEISEAKDSLRVTPTEGLLRSLNDLEVFLTRTDHEETSCIRVAAHTATMNVLLNTPSKFSREATNGLRDAYEHWLTDALAQQRTQVVLLLMSGRDEGDTVAPFRSGTAYRNEAYVIDCQSAEVAQQIADDFLFVQAAEFLLPNGSFQQTDPDLIHVRTSTSDDVSRDVTSNRVVQVTLPQ